jgi:hypothetical protein
MGMEREQFEVDEAFKDVLQSSLLADQRWEEVMAKRELSFAQFLQAIVHLSIRRYRRGGNPNRPETLIVPTP